MKKLFIKIFLILLLPFLSFVGNSSWIIVADKNDNVNLNENNTPVNVCYINAFDFKRDGLRFVNTKLLSSNCF